MGQAIIPHHYFNSLLLFFKAILSFLSLLLLVQRPTTNAIICRHGCGRFCQWVWGHGSRTRVYNKDQTYVMNVLLILSVLARAHSMEQAGRAVFLQKICR